MQYKPYYTLGNAVVALKIYIKHTALERSSYILFTVCNVRIQLNDYYPKQVGIYAAVFDIYINTRIDTLSETETYRNRS